MVWHETETDENVDKVKAAIEELKKSINLPEGVSFDGSRLDFDEDDRKAGGMLLILSIVFVYMLMAFFLKTVIPVHHSDHSLGLHGSRRCAETADTYIDEMVYMGGMFLIGIVVNNGIVLVDYANRLRRQGIERSKALLQATRHRFRLSS